jgi:hypothetical protein
MDNLRLWIGLLLVALAGCSTAPRPDETPSACAISEVSYDCQVERYNHVNVD